MTVGFHGSSQGLLGDLGKSVHIVDDDPAIDLVRRRVVQERARIHLTDKHRHMISNGLDAPILIRRQQHTLLQGLLAPQLGCLAPPCGRIVLQKVFHKGGFARARRSREKDMTTGFQEMETLFPRMFLAYEGSH